MNSTTFPTAIWDIIDHYSDFESCWIMYKDVRFLLPLDIKLDDADHPSPIVVKLIDKFKSCRIQHFGANLSSDKYSIEWAASHSSLLLLKFVYTYFEKEAGKTKYVFAQLCNKYSNQDVIVDETLACVRFLIEEAKYPWSLACDGSWSLICSHWNTVAIRNLVLYFHHNNPMFYWRGLGFVTRDYRIKSEVDNKSWSNIIIAPYYDVSDIYMHAPEHKNNNKNKKASIQSFNPSGCVHCNTMERVSKRCSICHVMYYCSVDCQSCHYKDTHKELCSRYKLYKQHIDAGITSCLPIWRMVITVLPFLSRDVLEAIRNKTIWFEVDIRLLNAETSDATDRFVKSMKSIIDHKTNTLQTKFLLQHHTMVGFHYRQDCLSSPVVEKLEYFAKSIGVTCSPANHCPITSAIISKQEIMFIVKVAGCITPLDIGRSIGYMISSASVTSDDAKICDIKLNEIKLGDKMSDTDIKASEIKTSEIKTSESKTSESKTSESKTSESKLNEIKSTNMVKSLSSELKINVSLGPAMNRKWMHKYPTHYLIVEWNIYHKDRPASQVYLDSSCHLTAYMLRDYLTRFPNDDDWVSYKFKDLKISFQDLQRLVGIFQIEVREDQDLVHMLTIHGDSVLQSHYNHWPLRERKVNDDFIHAVSCDYVTQQIYQVLTFDKSICYDTVKAVIYIWIPRTHISVL